MSDTAAGSSPAAITTNVVANGNGNGNGGEMFGSPGAVFDPSGMLLSPNGVMSMFTPNTAYYLSSVGFAGSNSGQNSAANHPPAAGGSPVANITHRSPMAHLMVPGQQHQWLQTEMLKRKNDPSAAESTMAAAAATAAANVAAISVPVPILHSSPVLIPAGYQMQQQQQQFLAHQQQFRLKQEPIVLGPVPDDDSMFCAPPSTFSDPNPQAESSQKQIQLLKFMHDQQQYQQFMQIHSYPNPAFGTLNAFSSSTPQNYSSSQNQGLDSYMQQHQTFPVIPPAQHQQILLQQQQPDAYSDYDVAPVRARVMKPKGKREGGATAKQHKAKYANRGPAIPVPVYDPQLPSGLADETDQQSEYFAEDVLLTEDYPQNMPYIPEGEDGGEEYFEPKKKARKKKKRACVKCGATQTPQWRRGPDGPQALLCNACGLSWLKKERRMKREMAKLNAGLIPEQDYGHQQNYYDDYQSDYQQEQQQQQYDEQDDANGNGHARDMSQDSYRYPRYAATSSTAPAVAVVAPVDSSAADEGGYETDDGPNYTTAQANALAHAQSQTPLGSPKAELTTPVQITISAPIEDAPTNAEAEAEAEAAVEGQTGADQLAQPATSGAAAQLVQEEVIGPLA